MAKVVLATGVEQLDNDIARELDGNGVEVAGECYYLEGILPCCIQKQADTVIISPELAGSSGLEEVIIALRRSPLDIRVILLPGPEDLEETRDLAGSVIGAGVYDIVFSTASSAGSKVNAREVAGRVLAPATYAEAEVLLTLGIGMPQANHFNTQEREQGQISDTLGVEADVLEDVAVQTGAKEGVKRARNIGLLKFMQDMIDRIYNHQKSYPPYPGLQPGLRSASSASGLNARPERMRSTGVAARASSGRAESTAEQEAAWGEQESDVELSWEMEAWDPPTGKERKTEDESVHGETAEKENQTLTLDTTEEKNEEKLPREDPAEKAGQEDNRDWIAKEEQTAGEDRTESPEDRDTPGANIPAYDHRKQVPEYQPGNPLFRRNQDTRRGLAFQSRMAMTGKRGLCYLPHQLIAVWSPDGWAKSYTAFNLAALAAAKGFDTALVNYDLLCPELDTWFGVKQTGIGDFEEHGAGVLTFGEDFKPELVARFLKKRAWGIRYLPAGNKLGNICAPGLDTEALEQTLKIVYQRNTGGKPAITIVDAGRIYEHVSTTAALRQAAIVLIPTDGSAVISEVTKRQIEELRRLGHNPRFIEVLFTTPGRKVFHICQERCSVAFDWMAYLIDQEAMKPQCLKVDGRRAWEGVLNHFVPIGDDNGFRRL